MPEIDEAAPDRNIGVAVLMPQLKHQFRVEWMFPDEDITNTIGQQVIDFNISFSENRVYMTIEQPACGGALYEVLYQVFDKGRIPTVQKVFMHPMTGGADYKLGFWLKPVSHEFVLDYSENGAAIHALEFEIDNMVSVEVEQDRKPLQVRTDDS